MISPSMATVWLSHFARVFFSIVLLLSAACNTKNQRQQLDHPRLNAKVAMRDVTFHSTAPFFTERQ